MTRVRDTRASSEAASFASADQQGQLGAGGVEPHERAADLLELRAITARQGPARAVGALGAGEVFGDEAAGETGGAPDDDIELGCRGFGHERKAGFDRK